jgi:hypothetical protein
MNILVICETPTFIQDFQFFCPRAGREFARLGHRCGAVPLPGEKHVSQGRWKAQPFFRDQVEIVPLRPSLLSTTARLVYHRTAYLRLCGMVPRKKPGVVPDVIPAIPWKRQLMGVLKKQFRCSPVVPTHGSMCLFRMSMAGWPGCERSAPRQMQSWPSARSGLKWWGQ